MKKIEDLKGQKFGRLLVVKRIENNNKGNAQWLCRCDCGKEIIVITANLKRGHTKSCGCLRRDNTSGKNSFLYKHGKYNTKLYKAWHNMKERCLNNNASHYKDYGGRGIKICDEWKNNFMNFYNWAINNGYKDNLTIDRIDNDGNYEPNNCRWITLKEQANNRRSNHLITYNGETHTMMEWAKIYNLSYNALRYRIKKGWDIKRALTERSKK